MYFRKKVAEKIPRRLERFFWNIHNIKKRCKIQQIKQSFEFWLKTENFVCFTSKQSYANLYYSKVLRYFSKETNVKLFDEAF